MKTKIYGSSDDLIEIEGAISEEANPSYATVSNGVRFTCSDDSCGEIRYSKTGEWKINVDEKGKLFDKLIQSTGEDGPDHTDIDCEGCSSYSDVLVLLPGIEWVRIGTKTFS